MDIRELYQELIIDHGTSPRNCCPLANAHSTAKGVNPLCGDNVCVYLQVQDQKIKQATFVGTGCAISIASASLMTEAILGKTTPEALALCHSFKNLLTTEGALPCESMGKLMALAGVKAFPSRVKCATLAWHTLQTAIHQNKGEASVVTTEIKTSTEDASKI